MLLCVCVYVCMCVYTHIHVYSLFSLSPIEEYWGSFHLLAIVNNAVVDISARVFCFEYLFSDLFGKHLGVELLGHLVIPSLTF